ncbi:MAG: apolipoprotein N-acyltransferase [Acidobacteria bacterium]|nr:apolipoprotein N-acyltransferase [Acidobacteriota bacterium]
MSKLLEFLRYPVAGAAFMLLAFPAFNLWICAWFALVPLLLHISRCRTGRAAFLAGFTTGLLFFTGLLYWIPRSMVAYGGISLLLAIPVLLLTCAILGCFFGAFALIIFMFYRRWQWKAFLLAPFAWVMQEFARNHLVLTGFPWGALGTSQVPFLYLIQIADITGVYGVSFVVMAANTTVFLALMKEVPRKLKLAWAAMVGILLIHVLLYAEFCHFMVHPQEGTAITLAGIQGNIREEDGYEQMAEVHRQVYPAMLAEACTGQPGVRAVIFPENPVVYLYDRDAEYRRLFERLATEHDITIFFNNIRIAGDETYYNSVYCLKPDGRTLSVYDKIHLVPFAEHVPFATVFFFADALSQEISHFTEGHEYVLHPLDGHPVGIFICYEAVFPNLVRGFTAGGAQLLINITNDAWFGRTAAPLQHFQHIILRAVENRRWIVRVANSGISAIIDPLGEVVHVQPQHERRIMTGDVYLRDDLSPYVRVGDLFAWFCTLLIGVIILTPLFRRFIHHDSGRSEERTGRDPQPHP